MYKCHDGLAPAYLMDKLDLHSEIKIRMTRHIDESTYNIPRTKTKAAEVSFAVKGPTVWNKIPLHIRNAPNLQTFKNNYNKEILQLDIRQQHIHQNDLTSTRPN